MAKICGFYLKEASNGEITVYQLTPLLLNVSSKYLVHSPKKAGSRIIKRNQGHTIAEYKSKNLLEQKVFFNK